MAVFVARKGGFQARIRRKGWPSESRTFATRRDAEVWARDREREMDRGLYLSRAASETTTLGDLADAWEKKHLAGKRAQTHYHTCLTRIRTAKALGKGQRAIATLTTAEAAAFRDELEACGLSPSTVRKVLFFAAGLIDFGIEDRGIVIPSNPFRAIRRPAEPRHRDRRLQEGEEQTLRAAIKTTRAAKQLEALFTLAIETGARLGELLSMRWDEVDLRSRVATIRGREIDGVRQLKNADPERFAPLSLPAVAALNALPRPLTGGRIFTTWARSDSFTHQWRRVCEAAKVKDLRFHDLRHEFASRMAPKVPMHVLMKLLGHKSPAMVARYYNQTKEDVSRLAVELYG